MCVLTAARCTIPPSPVMSPAAINSRPRLLHSLSQLLPMAVGELPQAEQVKRLCTDQVLATKVQSICGQGVVSGGRQYFGGREQCVHGRVLFGWALVHVEYPVPRMDLHTNETWPSLGSHSFPVLPLPPHPCSQNATCELLFDQGAAALGTAGVNK